MMISVDMSFWSAQIFSRNTLRCQLFMKAGLYHAANFLLDPRHVSLLVFLLTWESWGWRGAQSFSPQERRCVLCSPGHLSSSRPLSVTLICAFTEWRSCPQPVLVLGYLGKGTDPRIERAPLDTLFRATLGVQFTLAVLLSIFLE